MQIEPLKGEHMTEEMTYEKTGVRYADMDPFKREAQQAARGTSFNIEKSRFFVVEASRGESAFLIEAEDHFLAHVEEGLGSKNLVADAMKELTGEEHYHKSAQDTVAMIVNDIITLGAMPLSVAMHLAVGSSSWFNDEERSNALVEGWANACNLARCAWGPGETPTLKDMIKPSVAVISGSAMGIINSKERRIDGSKIEHGDSIIIIESSGIHANGLTLARKIAYKLSKDKKKLDGYLELLSDGRTYGDALLDPTLIYVDLVDDCLEAGIDLHYAVNITGHGWRKLMRAERDFKYVIESVPEPQPVFGFIMENGPVSEEEAYGNLNMGAGFALYVPQHHAQRVIEIANKLGKKAWEAGHIKKANPSEKKVVIKPKGIVFEESTLQVR